MKHVRTLTKHPDQAQEIQAIIGIIQLVVTIFTAIEAFTTAKD